MYRFPPTLAGPTVLISESDLTLLLDSVKYCFIKYVPIYKKRKKNKSKFTSYVGTVTLISREIRNNYLCILCSYLMLNTV